MARLLRVGARRLRGAGIGKDEEAEDAEQPRRAGTHHGLLDASDLGVASIGRQSRADGPAIVPVTTGRLRPRSYVAVATPTVAMVRAENGRLRHCTGTTR
jgi:hypothetical protein